MLANVQPETYIGFPAESNIKKPNFKVGDHVQILVYKIIFSKGYTRNWTKATFTFR